MKKKTANLAVDLKKGRSTVKCILLLLMLLNHIKPGWSYSVAMEKSPLFLTRGGRHMRAQRHVVVRSILVYSLATREGKESRSYFVGEGLGWL